MGITHHYRAVENKFSRKRGRICDIEKPQKKSKKSLKILER
jgi:hypothetical protein